jgi:hypothetical protein
MEKFYFSYVCVLEASCTQMGSFSLDLESFLLLFCYVSYPLDLFSIFDAHYS